MQHDRKQDRARAILGARVIFNHGNSTIDCQIRNISRVGAKLSLSQSVTLPEEFDIDVPQKGKVYRARMCWRDAENAGVEFLSGDSATPQAESLAALKAENAALNVRIVELTAKLERALASAGAGSERAA